MTDAFSVAAIPDTTNLTLSIPDVCVGNDATANISGQMADGTYTVYYDISGNTELYSVSSTAIISGGSGDGSFIIINAKHTIIRRIHNQIN